MKILKIYRLLYLALGEISVQFLEIDKYTIDIYIEEIVI